MMALATPETTAFTCRPGRGPPPTSSITSRSGVPRGTSPTPWRRVFPVTVHTIVPGDSSVPMVRNQAGPRATMRATLASVSVLLTSAGVTGSSGPAAVARPRRKVGTTRGNGQRPSMVSSRALSSP